MQKRLRHVIDFACNLHALIVHLALDLNAPLSAASASVTILLSYISSASTVLSYNKVFIVELLSSIIVLFVKEA